MVKDSKLSPSSSFSTNNLSPKSKRTRSILNLTPEQDQTSKRSKSSKRTKSVTIFDSESNQIENSVSINQDFESRIMDLETRIESNMNSKFDDLFKLINEWIGKTNVGTRNELMPNSLDALSKLIPNESLNASIGQIVYPTTANSEKTVKSRIPICSLSTLPSQVQSNFSNEQVSNSISNSASTFRNVFLSNPTAYHAYVLQNSLMTDFSGTEGESFESCWNSTEYAIQSCGIVDENQKILFLRRYLKGEAKSLIDSFPKSTVDTIGKLVDVLKFTFGAEESHDYENKLFGLKYDENVSLQSYLRSIKLYAKKAFPLRNKEDLEHTILRCFINGLPEMIRLKISINTPKTIEEAFKFANYKIQTSKLGLKRKKAGFETLSVLNSMKDFSDLEEFESENPHFIRSDSKNKGFNNQIFETRFR